MPAKAGCVPAINANFNLTALEVAGLRTRARQPWLGTSSYGQEKGPDPFTAC